MIHLVKIIVRRFFGKGGRGIWHSLYRSLSSLPFPLSAIMAAKQSSFFAKVWCCVASSIETFITVLLLLGSVSILVQISFFFGTFVKHKAAL